ncbi:YtxH domain-containing protein [uncultured Bacteroides sp.]|nr:YtxH domain-containing protein [uncultured Bacteroides sp.]
MEANRSNLLLGLAIGSVVGVFAHRFSRTTKAKILKKKIHHAMATVADRTEEFAEHAKKKVLYASNKAAEKMADVTLDIAEKVDDLKGKVHTAATEAKR